MSRRSNGRDSDGNGSGPQRFTFFTMVDQKQALDQVTKRKLDKNLACDMLSELYDLDIEGVSIHGIGAIVLERLRSEYPDLTSYKFYKVLDAAVGQSKRSRQETSPAEALPEATAVPIPGNPPGRRTSGRRLVLINKWNG